jgi:SPP1 gp7 family putative phage head morphogenesis protein
MSVQADIADVLHRQLVTAGQTEAIDLGKQLASEFRALEKATTPTPSQLALGFRFDVNSKQALDWANREAGQLITNMGAEQRKVIGQLVGQSMTQGLTAQQTGTAIHRLLNDVIPGTEYGKVTARTIGANMNGLTARSEQAVWNRAQKTAQDLADRGITGTKAVETLKKDTDRYAEKLRKSRARTIARTEIIRAAEEGRQQSWNQAIDKGLINKTTAKKTWRAGPFDVCPICSRLHGTSVPVQGDWGPNLQTPPAHPNCRCSMVLSSGVTEPPRAIGDGSTGNPFKLEFPQPPSPNDFPPLPTGPGPVAPPAPVPQPAPAVPEFQPASRQVLEDMIDRQRTAAITSDALPELEESLVDYVNGSGNYSLTNATLRGEFIFDDLMPKTQKKVIDMTDDLDELIKANVRTEDNLLLFRGVKDAGLDEWEFADVGDIVTEAGFSSTSFDRAIAQRFASKDGIVLEIEAPRGTKGIMPQAFRTGDKDFLLDGKGELEYLLQRNTQFEIVSREGNTIRVRIVGQIDPEPISTVFSPPPPVATPPAPTPVAPTPAPVAPPAPVVPAPTPAPPPPVASPTVVSGPSVPAPVDESLRTMREALDLPTATRGELKKRIDRLNEVVDAIDEIHYIPNDGMKNTVVRLGGTKNQSKGGHFNPGTRGPKPRRAKGESYSNYYDRVKAWSNQEVTPEIFVVARGWEGVGGEMTSFAHELGHRIDRVGNDYFTRRAWTKFKSGETLTENEQAVIDLIEEVKKAETFQRYYARTTQKQYFASPHEIWARSYAQWVGELSQNKKMLDAIAFKAQNTGYQFTKEEWETIGPLVTRIMERRGLMKASQEVIDDVVDLVDDIPLLGRFTPPELVPARHSEDYFKDRATQLLEDFRAQGGLSWDLEKNNIGTRTLWKEQGFDAKPTIVTDAQWADLEASGWQPMYRGLNADTEDELALYLRQFMEGDEPYAGSGLFGTGHYTSDIRGTAEEYARQAYGIGQEQRVKETGQVLDILLHKDAKIIDDDELSRKMRELVETRRRMEREIHGTRPDGTYARPWESLSENEQAILAQINDYESVIYEDPGRFATMLGYDAIRVKNPMVNWETQERLPDTFYVVLNRGALAVRSI